MATTKSKKKAAGKVGIQAPWVTHYEFVKAMFGRDEEINISELNELDNGNYEFIVSSPNCDKLTAIIKIFKSDTFKFGNVSLHIKFLVENDSEEYGGDDFETAFEDNPIFDEVITGKLPTGEEMYFVMFKKEVIQFYNDDISDPYGNFNGLAEDIARELFRDQFNVQFATSTNDPN